jgi:hypothetical protein
MWAGYVQIPRFRDTRLLERCRLAGIDRLKKLEIVRSCIAWGERVLPGVWADRVSRWCLLAAFAFFWLTVTLTEPLFVIPLVATVACIWLRGDQRAKALAELAELSDPDLY